MRLPVISLLPDLRAALEREGCAVLEAPPGAGKTTAVPPTLLDAPWLRDRRIVMLEPRRLAARAAAARMAAMLGDRVGGTVGYRVRLDSRVSAATRIEVVTEGILTRMLVEDPALTGVGLVIFDEFHERSLIGDTGLALTLATRELFRPDLRLLVMSATLDGEAVSRLLGNAPRLTSQGTLFPVSTSHRPARAGARMEAHVASVVREALAAEEGSVLVFLPGAAEIRRTEELLTAAALPVDVSVRPLHGSLSLEAQDAAIAPAPAGHRKVVLATNIAETSLTIEGIGVVIDAGWMRLPRFSPRTGMTRLETVRVTRAAADQRRGRAGRLGPGRCIRCWSPEEEAGLVPATRAEILDADLAPMVLDLAAAGFPDPSALRWLDPPPPAALAQARDLLMALGALDGEGRLTPHGRAMSALGTHPRLAHLLARAAEADADTRDRAAMLAALLEERDPLRGEGKPAPADITLRLDVVQREHGAMLDGVSVDRGAVHRVRQMAAEWTRRLPRASAAAADSHSTGLLLALAYPDRVAQQRGAAGKFLLRSGRGAQLHPADPLAHSPWLVAAELDDTGRDSRIVLAAALDIEEVQRHAAEQIVTRDEITWEEATQSVTARRRTMLGALVLRDVALPAPPADLLGSMLEEGVRRLGVAALPWEEVAALRQRLSFLHAHDPGWPDVSDPALLERLDRWFTPFVPGIRALDRITPAMLREGLLSLLTAAQRRALDTEAPERIEVPSGSMIRVDYTDPEAPVLAVRLQEVFGWMETPRVGRVPLVLHLLSPAGRPVQVTRDLAGFWRNGYFDVRRDLRGRYPRHPWPEDPLTAAATRGAKRRR